MDLAKDISDGTAPDVYAMDDGFTDVAVSSGDVGASLPSVEEVRATVNMRGSRSGMSCKTLMLITVGGLVLMASSIGLAVGISNKNKGGGNDQPSSGGSSGLDKIRRKSDFDEVASYMILSGVSNENTIRTLGTPQNIAAIWMALDDEANMAVPPYPINVAEGYRYVTRYVMAVVYFSMGGADWEYQADFGTIADVCNWNQVNFDGSEFYRQGVLCDSRNGLIFALNLGT
jgi:hypothetical protein